MLVDEISSLAKKDSVILKIGARLYKRLKCQTEKKHEVEKRVRTIMRLLARLYLAFKKETNSPNDAPDMFRREGVPHLCAAIEKITEDDKGGKSTLKIQLQNTVKKPPRCSMHITSCIAKMLKLIR